MPQNYTGFNAHPRFGYSHSPCLSRVVYTRAEPLPGDWLLTNDEAALLFWQIRKLTLRLTANAPDGFKPTETPGDTPSVHTEKQFTGVGYPNTDTPLDRLCEPSSSGSGTDAEDLLFGDLVFDFGAFTLVGNRLGGLLRNLPIVEVVSDAGTILGYMIETTDLAFIEFNAGAQYTITAQNNISFINGYPDGPRDQEHFFRLEFGGVKIPMYIRVEETTPDPDLSVTVSASTGNPSTITFSYSDGSNSSPSRNLQFLVSDEEFFVPV